MEALFEYSTQFRAPVWMVLIRIVAVLCLGWFLGSLIWGRLNRFNVRKEKGFTFYVLLASIIGWLVLFSIGMLRHLSFHSKAWDLAIFDQLIWNLANGNGWECSVRGMVDMRGDHFEPIILLFVPFYKIYPHVAWLLGFQALALVGAGLILWSLSRRLIGESCALILFLAYLFYPQIHWLALADFHPIAFAPLFVLIAWSGRERNSIYLWLGGLIGLVLCGEEGFIVAGWWGLWEFVSRFREKGMYKWVSLISAILFSAGFIYISFIFIPAHRFEAEGYFYVHRYSYLGNDIKEIAFNFVTKPWLWLSHLLDGRSFALIALYLAPLGFLPAFRPKILALLLPTFIYTLISESPEQKSIFHQYTSMFIPFLMIAVLEAIRWGRMNRQKSALIALTSSFLGFLAFSPTLGFSMHPELLMPESWAGEAKGIIMQIAPDQPVSAPSALCPHLSHRRVLLLKPNDKWQDVDEVLILPDFPPPE